VEEEKGRERKGIPAKDFHEAFLDVQLKKILGYELTKGERWIYYYGAHAPRCHHPNRP
jgi:hypothetical protein